MYMYIYIYIYILIYIYIYIVLKRGSSLQTEPVSRPVQLREEWAQRARLRCGAVQPTKEARHGEVPCCDSRGTIIGRIFLFRRLSVRLDIKLSGVLGE